MRANSGDTFTRVSKYVWEGNSYDSGAASFARSLTMSEVRCDVHRLGWPTWTARYWVKSRSLCAATTRQRAGTSDGIEFRIGCS